MLFQHPFRTYEVGSKDVPVDRTLRIMRTRRIKAAQSLLLTVVDSPRARHKIGIRFLFALIKFGARIYSPASPRHHNRHVPPRLQRQQVGIASSDRVDSARSSDFYEPSVFGPTCVRFGLALLRPRIRPYSSADMTTDTSRFFRRMSTRSCWTASRSAPKRFRAVVTVRVFIYPSKSTKLSKY